MNFRNKLIVITLLLLVCLIASGVAMAQVRINPPPYHFGGDTLFCEQGEGCTLLDKDGNFLWSWTQAEVDAAYSAVGETGVNTQVGGDGTGTYGVAQLWVVPPATNGIHNRLCFFGYDEWLKDNFMCFLYTADGVYVPLGLPGDAIPVADCSMWSVGQYVEVISIPLQVWRIASIDAESGSVGLLQKKNSITVGCDEIVLAPG